MDQVFEHEPLEVQNSIRLLEILPGKSTDPIRCSCVHTTVVDVNQKPFEAVSYTWGDPTKSHPITINGRQFLTTRNAHDVLQSMRCKDRVRSIWIDAICINQDDADEKNHQLPLMKGIYSSATQVYAWLGEASADSGLALIFIRKLKVLYRKCTRMLGDPVPPYPEGLRGSMVEDVLQLISKTLRSPALCEFLKRPWFRRIWVYQEVILAKRIQMVCGSESVDFQDFAPVVHWLMCWEAAINKFYKSSVPFFTSPLGLMGPYSAGLFRTAWDRWRFEHHVAMAGTIQVVNSSESVDSEDFVPVIRRLMYCKATTVLHYKDDPKERGVIDRPRAGFIHLSRMHETRYNANHKNQLLTLEDHLCEPVPWEATDPRDMIFAVLGIIAEGNEPELKPDYRNSVVDVFVAATESTIITRGSLRILCCAGVGQQNQISNLPTWVPDYTSFRPYPAIGMMGEKSLYGKKFPQISVSFQGKKMMVRGTRVGVVDCMGRVNDQAGVKDGWNARSRELFKWLEDSRAALGSVRGMIWRTLVQNDFERTGISSHAGFESWQRLMRFKRSRKFRLRDLKSVYPMFRRFPKGFGKTLQYPEFMFMRTIYMRLAKVSTYGLAIVPRQTEVGDVVCILFGLSVPMILRENAPRSDGQQSFSVVGGCYVDGLDLALPEELVEEDFILT